MARSSSYTYDAKTGTWSMGTTTSDDNSSQVNNSGENLTSSTSDSNSGQGAVEKQYNEIELNTLSGSLSFIVSDSTIKLKAGDTVKLQGLGKYLSGSYYVKDITRTIDSNGYSHSATVIKTDFGKSLKVNSSNAKKTTQKAVQSSSQSNTSQRKYTVKKGDCLWNIAKMYYGKGYEYTKISKANNIGSSNLILPGQVLIIP